MCEVIERMTFFNCSKTQKFCLSVKIGGRPGVQEVAFQIGEGFWNKAPSINISATTNEQKATLGKLWGFFLI